MGGDSAKPTGEIVALTSLRGYLSLWVVAYHFWNDAVRLFSWADALSPVARVGHMAVPAFFMLSGFVLSHNYAARFAVLRRAEVLRFLWLRLGRIYPVHVATLLAVAAMVWVSGRAGYQLTDAGYTTGDFVRNVFLVHTWVPDFRLNWNYPSWSISSEWFAYLLFPFVAAGVLRRLTTPRRAGLFALLAVAASVGVAVGWRPWPYYELVLVVPTFLAGAAAFALLRGRTGTGPRRLPEVLVLALGAACFVPSGDAVAAVLLCGCFALIVALVRCGPGAARVWTAGPVVFLGEVSYSLYMTHTLAQKVLYRLLPAGRFESADVATKVGVVLAYVALVVVCCLATYYLVERPCRRWFKAGRRR